MLADSPRRPATHREGRWSSNSRLCATADGGTVPTFASQSQGGHWWTWAQDVAPPSLNLTQTLTERMPWINTKLSSKDSLAVRPGQNEAQQSDIRAHSERKAVMPISFFTDLYGQQRMIKASSKTPINPFHATSRNPLPVGWGLQDAGRHSKDPINGHAKPNIPNPRSGSRSARWASPRASSQSSSTSSGKIVRELVESLQVEVTAAIRAAKATGHSTVAAAMEWLLNNDSGAVANLEQRSRKRYFSNQAIITHSRNQVGGVPVAVAEGKHKTAQRYLDGQENFSGGSGGRLGPGGWLVGGGLKAAKKGYVRKSLEKCRARSDAGSICINMDKDDGSVGSWSRTPSSPASRRPVITVIPHPDTR
jgi:hypothetical protein